MEKKKTIVFFEKKNWNKKTIVFFSGKKTKIWRRKKTKKKTIVFSNLVFSHGRNYWHCLLFLVIFNHLILHSEVPQQFLSNCPLNGKVHFFTHSICAAHRKRREKLNFPIKWTARKESLSYRSKYCNVFLSYFFQILVGFWEDCCQILGKFFLT